MTTKLNKQKAVIIVENSKSVVGFLKKRIENELHLKVFTASTLKDADEILSGEDYFFPIGIFGLFLQDGSGDEVVEFALNRGVGPIIFTGKPDEKTRKSMWSKGIVDYVIKDSQQSLDNVITSLGRFLRNAGTTVLAAVTDPAISEVIGRLLRAQNSRVLAAESYEEAMELFNDNPAVDLAFIGGESDFNSSVRMLNYLRKFKPREELSIIHITDRDREDEAVQFIKYGADDYLCAPFSAEHFYCRVNNQLDTLEAFKQLRYASTTDFLTGANNRRCFMKRFLVEQKRMAAKGGELAVVMMDADKFKNVNDTYGHDVGDLVLKRIAEVVHGNMRPQDVFGRLGGEEFALVMPEMNMDEAREAADHLRSVLSMQKIPVDNGALWFTLSFGLSGCCYLNGSDIQAEQLLKEADMALYQAKEGGRNRVEIYCRN